MAVAAWWGQTSSCCQTFGSNSHRFFPSGTKLYLVQLIDSDLSPNRNAFQYLVRRLNSSDQEGIKGVLYPLKIFLKNQLQARLWPANMKFATHLAYRDMQKTVYWRRGQYPGWSRPFWNNATFCLFYTCCILANSFYSFSHADFEITQHRLEALRIKNYQNLLAALEHVGVAKRQHLTIKNQWWKNFHCASFLTSTDHIHMVTWWHHFSPAHFQQEVTWWMSSSIWHNQLT